MDHKLYAQILNGIITNIIVLDDESLSDLFSEGFDYFIRIDEMDPMPCIGWEYDGNEFIPIQIEEQT